MRTRNAETPKSATPAKKTPTSRKSGAKTLPNPAERAPQWDASPVSAETKRVSATKAKQVKTDGSSTPNSMPEPAEEARRSDDAVQVTPEIKVVSGPKKTRKVIRKVVRKKTPTSAGAVSRSTPKSGEAGNATVEEAIEKEEVENTRDVEPVQKQESFSLDVQETAKNKGPAVENYEAPSLEDQNLGNVEEQKKKEEVANEVEEPLIENVRKSPMSEDPVVADPVESSENQESGSTKEEHEADDKTKEVAETGENKVELKKEPINMEEDTNEKLKGEDASLEEAVDYSDEKMEDYGDHKVHEELGDEEYVESDLLEHGEEAEVFEDEQTELTAAARERKIRKELEIFVGGLDRDAKEEDVKKAFENVGEVVEVRLHKDSSTSKNKGYAFVKFATKEQASRALSEMRNPVIHGKRCGTAPSEDNDTLFLGNICNTWTKEAVKQKLKDYGMEGVERITLVSDVQHEGLSRGFAFIEFSCHADAMLAYKRLQKPDVIFGHPERTVKVAFAEPLREPDPDVMAKVKSVFVDGIPPHWDEDRVREHFKGYGEITRITLARNMSTAKRRDFGFVDFSTHEAAVACVDGTNNKELGNGKVKVRVRLSNPLPKTQAVKGGMCGGFRIGRGGAGNFSNFGRGFGRGGHPFSRANFQHGRGFYQHGRGQFGRMGFVNEFDSPFPPFHGRSNFGRGGRMGPFRDARLASDGGTMPARTNLDRGRPFPLRRQPYSLEEEFDRPFVGRHFDDPYFYDDHAHGLKRPFFMSDQDPDYIEPSRLRPRLDYSDSAVSFRGTHYQDTFGARGGLYPQDYYGSDRDGGAYSSYYGGDRPYGGGYYY